MDRRKFLKSLVATAVISPVIAKEFILISEPKIDFITNTVTEMESLAEFGFMDVMTYIGDGKPTQKLHIPPDWGMVWIRPT